MFYHDNELQYPVEVEEPDPVFAKMLQQAIGGVEGEMRVCLQYLFQAWGQPSTHDKYRNMLLETAAEEMGHVEMLATAVAKNLEGAPVKLRDEMKQDRAVSAAMNGVMPRQILSSGMNAMPVDSNGAPFNASYIVASGNLAADMYANVMAESTGRLLATRLWEMTDDPGMKDMLSYLVARDRMHQNQWLAVLEELEEPLPIPSDFQEGEEPDEFEYAFMSTHREERDAPEDARWTQGPSVDGKGEFSYRAEQPGGGKPDLAMAPTEAHNKVQVKQRAGSPSADEQQRTSGDEGSPSEE